MTRITLAHGNGGRFMRELIEEVIAPALGAAAPDISLDAAPFDPGGDGPLVVTTDGFTVQPLEFPGGDLGSLAVHGTVNDLAVAGATPLALTLGAVIEEGLEIATLRRLIESFGRAATEAGVRVLAGDTKVVPQGAGGGLYLTVAGIGRLRRTGLSLSAIRPGDRFLVSGPVGDHGIAVMFARAEFDLEGDLLSDSAPVARLVAALDGIEGVRFLRDPTRGGFVTVGHEIAQARGVTVRIDETALPVRETVRGVCEILGYDPTYLACEGRVVAVVSPEAADAVLRAWQALPEGREAAVVGTVEPGAPRVVMTTELGGDRILAELEDDPLPRIC